MSRYGVFVVYMVFVPSWVFPKIEYNDFQLDVSNTDYEYRKRPAGEYLEEICSFFSGDSYPERG